MSGAVGTAGQDVEGRNGRPYNVATYTRPCVIHANGWEKMPLIRIVEECGHITSSEREELLRTKSTFDKAKVNKCIDRC
jgi:hypothetical protein